MTEKAAEALATLIEAIERAKAAFPMPEKKRSVRKDGGDAGRPDREADAGR